jgi:hypothetical protein
MNEPIPGNAIVREQLHKWVEKKKAVAFVGAGASAPLYPLWPELIERMICRGESTGATAADVAAWREGSSTDPQSIAQSLREKLGQGRFGNLLADIFRTRRGDDGRTFTPVYGALLRANFAGFITTNYDPGLLEARLAIRRSCTATGFVTSKDEFIYRWETGDIFEEDECPVLFAHGIHQRPETIVLTLEDYQTAYGSGAWRRCFDTLMTRQHLIFVGYGFSDPYLEFLTQENILSTKADQRGEPRHIAILPHPPEAYSDERRLSFRRRYHTEILFYHPVQDEHGAWDYVTPLLRELDQLAPHADVGASPVVGGQPNLASPEQLPECWTHETTNDDQYRGRGDNRARGSRQDLPHRPLVEARKWRASAEIQRLILLEFLQ